MRQRIGMVWLYILGACILAPMQSRAVEYCQCHNQVDKEHTVRAGESPRRLVIAYVITKKVMPDGAVGEELSTHVLSRNQTTDFGAFCRENILRVWFYVLTRDRDEDVCDPGRADVMSKQKATGTGGPSISIDGGAASLLLNRNTTMSGWEYTGLWRKTWPLQLGTHDFCSVGYVEDTWNDHQLSDDVDIDLFGHYARITIIKVDRGDDLWWFGGEDPGGGYQVKTWLRASGVTEGTFRWDVSDGAGIVDLTDGVTDADIITRINNNTVWLKSTRGSSSELDTAVTLTYNNMHVCEVRYTVGAPQTADLISGPDDHAIGSGFETVYWFRVLDQFGVLLPYDLPGNEAFGPWVSDWTTANGRPTNENWPEPAAYGTLTRSRRFKDTYSFVSMFHDPITVPPSNTHAGEKVQHAEQFYRMGSLTTGSGVLIKSHRLQHYRGKARQE